MKKIKDILLYIVNCFIAKKERFIYISKGMSTGNNCHDILNYSGDNSFSFLNTFLKYAFPEKVTVFIDYFDDKRIGKYLDVAKKAKKNNIDLVFIRSYQDQVGWKRLKLLVCRFYHLYQSKLWVIGSGDGYIYGKLKCQSVLNTNYFISCKNDFIKGKNDRWRFIDYFLSTSLLHSTVSAAQTGVKLDNCIELGFPRNDTLFASNKKDIIYSWLISEIGYEPQKIIIYAPTYRDYEKDKLREKRFLFGYDMPELEAFLAKNRVCMIAKLHNLTCKEQMDKPKGVVDFNICYDFTFYDLMAFADCVITDYSSLGYDFLLLNKPLIYNLYDQDKYVEDRGLSYEPYESFCPGIIVKDENSMMLALKDVVENRDAYLDKREHLADIFHKYKDGNSSKRLCEYVVRNILGYSIDKVFLDETL